MTTRASKILTERKIRSSSRKSEKRKLSQPWRKINRSFQICNGWFKSLISHRDTDRDCRSMKEWSFRFNRNYIAFTQRSLVLQECHIRSSPVAPKANEKAYNFIKLVTLDKCKRTLDLSSFGTKMRIHQSLPTPIARSHPSLCGEVRDS